MQAYLINLSLSFFLLPLPSFRKSRNNISTNSDSQNHCQPKKGIKWNVVFRLPAKGQDWSRRGGGGGRQGRGEDEGAVMKKELKGMEFALFRQPRLSVLPVEKGVWKRGCRMGGGYGDDEDDGDDGDDKDKEFDNMPQ